MSPFSFRDTDRPTTDGWSDFLPVSIAISLGLSAIGLGAYCFHKKGCKKPNVCKSKPDVEDSGEEPDSLRQEGDESEKDGIWLVVISTLHELATETRHTGTLPRDLSKPRETPNIYPDIPTELADGADTVSSP